MRSNKWFTLSEASATLNISLSTLRRHIDKGKYKTKTEQGRRLVKLIVNPIMNFIMKPR